MLPVTNLLIFLAPTEPLSFHKEIILSVTLGPSHSHTIQRVIFTMILMELPRPTRAQQLMASLSSIQLGPLANNGGENTYPCDFAGKPGYQPAFNKQRTGYRPASLIQESTADIGAYEFNGLISPFVHLMYMHTIR